MSEEKETAEVKETPEITEQAVVDKVTSGEKLTPEETEAFKSIPPGEIPAPSPAPTKTEEKKPDTSAAAQPQALTEERRQLINAELDKSDNEVDLSKFKSPIELGLYWDLKKARRKNAQLQENLESERVERIVERIQSKRVDTAPVEEVTEEEEVAKLLKELDDDDVLTTKEIKAALAKQAEARKAKKATETTKKPESLLSIERIRIEKLEADNLLRSKGMTDFNEVADFAEEALKTDAEAIEILRDTAKSGGNVALKTYYLIKGSKAWPAIEKVLQADREKATGKVETKDTTSGENLARAKKIEENDQKTKTTGAGTGAAANANEFTIGEIQSMSIKDVKKLSKAQRQAILEKFGSTPNYST